MAYKENNPEETRVRKKKKKRKVNPIKRTLAVIGTTILSLVLIVIITGSIIAAALTVYVLQFVDQDPLLQTEFYLRFLKKRLSCRACKHKQKRR